ncbi:hypothetical protein FEM03_23100 [Phragmitibacter flavus]|uniref:DUF892 family protein n=1 Tax=Phragmitibacter flavus TaxID=2576071 RepID=A0A5R8K7S8_9BACT|nr:hypothetical protein [Phragmitibacter flavus]TLD68392.1 hypothetical protein FEM03_23100 [Phragmitibacter flavus]
MNPSKNHAVVRTYVNDMIAVERDIFNAISGQIADDKVKVHTEIHRMLSEIAAESEQRLAANEQLSERLHGKLGAVVKEAIAATTGVLAGIYGMVRKHPVSKMLRDDHVALNLAAVAYGMLYTTAVALDEDDVAAVALENLNSLPPRLILLSRAIPSIVVKELSHDYSTNFDAPAIATLAMEKAWINAEAGGVQGKFIN